MVIDNNPENVTHVNDRYSDLKDRTADTLKKLDDVIGQLEKNLDVTKKFIDGRNELQTELVAIRDKVESMGPAPSDSEKIGEQLKELEVSPSVVFYLALSKFRSYILY